jgi:IS4 transposase
VPGNPRYKNRGHHRVGIIWLERPGKVILLATNLAVEDAEGFVVAEMYRRRRRIELFFWWLIEPLHFHVQGMVGETELIAGLKARAREADLARESSRKRYLANKQAAGK